MLKIGEFSKLSRLTVKALRFYEKEELLKPAYIDKSTRYRFYETDQLKAAAKIKAFRRLGLSIDEIRSIQIGADVKTVLLERAKLLAAQIEELESKLSVIDRILENNEMKYQVEEKTAPRSIVYYSETVLEKYQDCMEWIPALGQECLRLNPGIQCAEPHYEFCEYLDGEYKDRNIRIRHNEAVTSFGVESDAIKFREIPETKVLSVYHKGPYDTLGEAYAFIAKYAEENGYKPSGPARERYIDGIWNKESVDDWLTEIQLPIE